MPRMALRLAAVAAALCAAVPSSEARPRRHDHHPPAMPRVAPPWPLEILNASYQPLAWADVVGWSDDDPRAAFETFRTSCRPHLARKGPASETKAIGDSLRAPCEAARRVEAGDAAAVRRFFEEQFAPLRIARLGDAEGFVTGYYEPIIDGSREPGDVFNVPVYRRPSSLFVRGATASAAGLPNKGQVFRKIGRRKLVPFYDRAEIEDGAIAGRGLEIAFVKSQTDLLFAQIQGSARIRLEDGSMLRVNYDAHNGFPYTPVGRILIERGLVPREEMSMQRIRQWMDANPDGAKDLRRANRSYVFFREVQLGDKDEAVGAQGVPLTAGRSIAVDKALHVYGTPFFIEGDLPIEGDNSRTPFRRLMIAQDTGSAIVGPARADLYFGAGYEAGQIAGRMRHGARFTMLVPKALDPAARAAAMPLPQARPAETLVAATKKMTRKMTRKKARRHRHGCCR